MGVTPSQNKMLRRVKVTRKSIMIKENPLKPVHR